MTDGEESLDRKPSGSSAKGGIGRWMVVGFAVGGIAGFVGTLLYIYLR